MSSVSGVLCFTVARQRNGKKWINFQWWYTRPALPWVLILSNHLHMHRMSTNPLVSVKATPGLWYKTTSFVCLEAISRSCHPSWKETRVNFTPAWKAYSNIWNNLCYSETFSFMLTGEDGSRRFGYCRRLLVSTPTFLWAQNTNAILTFELVRFLHWRVNQRFFLTNQKQISFDIW